MIYGSAAWPTEDGEHILMNGSVPFLYPVKCAGEEEPSLWFNWECQDRAGRTDSVRRQEYGKD